MTRDTPAERVAALLDCVGLLEHIHADGAHILLFDFVRFVIHNNLL